MAYPAAKPSQFSTLRSEEHLNGAASVSPLWEELPARRDRFRIDGLVRRNVANAPSLRPGHLPVLDDCDRQALAGFGIKLLLDFGEAMRFIGIGCRSVDSHSP